MALRKSKITRKGQVTIPIEFRRELELHEGDTVLFAKYAGTEIKIDGQKLLILRESDLLAIVVE